MKFKAGDWVRRTKECGCFKGDHNKVCRECFMQVGAVLKVKKRSIHNHLDFKERAGCGNISHFEEDYFEAAYLYNWKKL